MKKARQDILLIFALVVCCLATPARGFTLSPTVEAITIPSVGGTFQPVAFENSYTNAVPVCTYNLPSAASPSAVIRIQTITATGMQIRLQQPRNSAVVTPGPVFCLIAETGVSILPDGRRIEARSAAAPNTHGRNVPLNFNNGSISSMNNVSGLFSGFTNPAVLGQVITFNDPNFSVFHANDCENRGNPPYNSGFADGICVTKHVGEDNIVRAAETLGIIVIEQGIGSYPGIAYEADLGPDNVNGVDNGIDTYSLSGSFEFAVATQSGEDGGDGGRAVFVGAGAVGGTTLGLAIDEDILNDSERNHTTEPVAYFAVRRLPIFTASKTVDRPSIAETLTLNYTISLENTGQLDQTGVVLDDTLPDGSTGTVTGPVESGTADGVFEAGETWTYTISYVVTPADIAAGTDLVNSVSVTTDQYGTEGIADETSSATTVIVPGTPSITVTKTADNDTNVPEGVTVTYTYVVANTGNQFISNVTLADAHGGSGPAPAPTNETLSLDAGVSGDSTDGIANDGIWDTLAPGDEVTFTATYVVTQNDVDTLQ
ncbi:MAG: hypothetical protein QNJ29_07710 [Rhizobiaceae bacterium]|nr:hypothetical protein [Rhizobiaceae bacterium]